VHRKVHRTPYPQTFQWFLCTASAKQSCPPCIGVDRSHGPDAQNSSFLRREGAAWRKTAQKKSGRPRVFMDLYAPECGRIMYARLKSPWRIDPGRTLPG
jgi:hypothetical protein